MFCEVHGLRPQSTIQGVMSVVECMNTVFSCFDSLTDRFNVYKVNVKGLRNVCRAWKPKGGGYCLQTTQKVTDKTNVILRYFIIKRSSLPCVVYDLTWPTTPQLYKSILPEKPAHLTRQREKCDRREKPGKYECRRPTTATLAVPFTATFLHLTFLILLRIRAPCDCTLKAPSFYFSVHPSTLFSSSKKKHLIKDHL